MLKEIRSNAFKLNANTDNETIRPTIIFHSGLNIVNGSDTGTNSIGKSNIFASPNPKYPSFTGYTNRKITKLAIAPIHGLTLLKILSQGIIRSMEDPNKVRTPNITLESGINMSVANVITIPAPNTWRPRFSLFLPICQQNPDTQIKLQQILCCHI